ncbi:helix-turn-helix transcriptional regulator [Actinoplanes couchii]|uniref:Transcriptional regulator n=1 Tax=Actinoplanes couchii TaxID=403638 RepID=A0ABQ3X1D9_9ACTN|nr:LuxR family transcriptional regulator [Actinoplanes couchii]GID52344.1 transcriptional regulator [Actinoplanes couchii]
MQKVALAAIAQLVTATSEGHGGALALTGTPGDGRTTLLRAVPDLLPHRTGTWIAGFVTGHAEERELPHHGLRTLLAGLCDRVGAACPPVLTGDPLTVRLAVLALLRTIAEAGPVLCLVDDAHLLDPESWQVLAFAARRISGDRVALVASFPVGAEPAGMPVHRLQPLSPEAARDLLRRHAPDLADDVAGALTELAEGHPAALIDLVGTLTPEQRRGYAPPPDALPPDSPAHRAFTAELDALPLRTRLLLQFAAAAPDTAPDILLAAAARACPTSAGWGLEDFGAAERAGIVEVTAGGVRFSGGLRRGVAYRQMEIARRRIAHLALADVLEARGEGTSALLHRGAAATGPDVALGRRLARIAAAADPPVAAAARRCAAGLVTGNGERAALLLAAARDSWLAGRPHEAGLLVRRIPAAAGGARVRARALTAEMGLPGGAPGARDVLLDVAAELAETDPGTALDALALAGEAACRPAEQRRFAELAARVSAACPGAETPATMLVRHHVAGLARIAAGDESGSFGPLRRAVALADRVAEPEPLLRAAVAGILVGDSRRAAALAGRAAVLARERGAPVLVPQALELAALAGMASGDYAAAGEAALDGAAVARGTGQPILAGSHLGVLAVLAALFGDRDTALSRITAVGDGPARPLCEWALAVLDLVDGRGRPAADRLLAVLTGPPGPGSALLRVAVVPHLLEARARSHPAEGQARQAVEDVVAEAFDRWAGRTGQPGWLALRDRCRALRADDGEEASGHFEAALGHDGEAGFPRAHTQLLFGRMLRRRRRHVEARTHLRRAADTFQALDAGPWAAQSIRELRAAGDRVEPHAPAGRALTAQQERIAALVAGGATNREVAHELHLSPRTVDHHLRNVFTRLGVRSRTEMARLLTGQDQRSTL